MRDSHGCGEGSECGAAHAERLIEHGEPAAARMPGWIHTAPDSWLHTFIRYVPAASRLALFKTSRQLARCVMQCAPNIKLNLTKAPGGSLESRRILITSLLGEDRDFNLELTNAYQQPYPVVLGAHVQKLCLRSGSHGEGLARSYAQFTNLKELSLTHTIGNADIQNLCHAVQAGHLKSVSHFCAGSSGMSPVAKRLFVRTFGPQITSLHCCSGFLLYLSIEQFPKLEKLQLDRGYVNHTVLKSWCQHKSLRRLSLCSVITLGPMRQGPVRRPKWDWLHLESTSCDVLNAVSLNGVKRLVVGRKICTGDGSVLSSVLASHASKLVFGRGPYQEFTIEGLNLQTLQCLNHLEPSCRVLLLEHVEHPSLIPALWACLPKFIHTIGFKTASEIDCTKFWDGFPMSVSRVLYVKLGVPVVSYLLHGTAPTHVQVIHVKDAHWWADLEDLMKEEPMKAAQPNEFHVMSRMFSLPDKPNDFQDITNSHAMYTPPAIVSFPGFVSLFSHSFLFLFAAWCLLSLGLICGLLFLV